MQSTLSTPLTRLLLATSISVVAVSSMLFALSAQAHNGSSHDTAYKHEFTASLSGSSEVPPVSTTSTTGNASFRVHGNEQTIDFDLNVMNGENITAAHLHCATEGSAGPIAVGLYTNSAGSDINGNLVSGTITASDIQSACQNAGIHTLPHLIQAMREGRIYVNVHSTEYPNGLARGQLMPEEENASGYDVMVMKHICNDTIRSIEDFEALEAGKDPVSVLVATVLACPTTGLPGDEPVAGAIASPRAQFDFNVIGSSDAIPLADTNYMPLKLCETDLNLDADNNGNIASSTCLDVSHYSFMGIEAHDGRITVSETDSPPGTRFGTVRFTPTVLDQNNDKDALESIQTEQGQIMLDMSNDTDGMVMMHVYNFPTENADEGENDLIGEIRRIIAEINQLRLQLVTLLEDWENQN